MTWLIKNKYLQTGQSIILYSDAEKRIDHAGIYENNGKVKSKWGIGNLWEHKELEIPKDYGDKISIYGKIKKEDAFQYFKCYLHEYQLTEKLLQNYLLSSDDKNKLNNKINWTMLVVIIKQILLNKTWSSENWKPKGIPRLGALLTLKENEGTFLSFAKNGKIINQKLYTMEKNNDAIHEFIKQIYRGKVNDIEINDDRNL